MSIDDLLQKERNIWGTNKQTLEHIVICMGKTYGDIAKQARSKLERAEVEETELKKELGNMISSTVRWVDDLGFDVEDCLQLALESQQNYQKTHE